MMSTEKIKCLIIGSGPAGYTAAIYTSRANLKPVLYQGMQPGGQLITTTEVENFPGYPLGVSSHDMMHDLELQAKKFGADIRYGTITSVDLSERPFKVVVDEENNLEAETIILATGATARYLGLESEEHLRGHGVSACATCDGFFYRGQDVAVVGGGDTACEEALYLSGLCNKVYMIVRRDVLRASKVMQERVLNNPKIEMLWECNTQEVLGNTTDGVTGVVLRHKSGEIITKNISGFFLAIGHHPNTELVEKWVERDKEGYIITQAKSTKTNVEGLFAAGDVQDPNFRQAITAAASGCMAAIEVERFLIEQC